MWGGMCGAGLCEAGMCGAGMCGSNVWGRMCGADVWGRMCGADVWGRDLVVAAMFVQQGDDGLDVVLLDDVQNLGALDQNAVKHLQDPYGATCGAPDP